jgi:hypothetical protein
VDVAVHASALAFQVLLDLFAHLPVPSENLPTGKKDFQIVTGTTVRRIARIAARARW